MSFSNRNGKPSKAETLLDIALEGRSEEEKRKTWEIVQKSGVHPDEEFFAILVATGHLRVLLLEHPQTLLELLNAWNQSIDIQVAQINQAIDSGLGKINQKLSTIDLKLEAALQAIGAATAAAEEKIESESAQAAQAASYAAKQSFYKWLTEISDQFQKKLLHSHETSVAQASFKKSLLPVGGMLVGVIGLSVGGGYWMAAMQMGQNAQRGRIMWEWNNNLIAQCQASKKKQCLLWVDTPPRKKLTDFPDPEK